MAPHVAQAPRAVVTSSTNSSRRTPAMALPSSFSCVSSMLVSASGRSESLGLDPRRIVAELHERLRDRLDKWSRTADECQWVFPWRPRHLVEHVAIDTPPVPGPVRWL